MAKLYDRLIGQLEELELKERILILRNGFKVYEFM
jgi:hypothetical protein